MVRNRCFDKRAGGREIMDELECSAECEREVCSILGYCPYIKELEDE